MLINCKRHSIYEISEAYIYTSENYEPIDSVSELINYFRRKNKNKSIRIQELMDGLKHNPEHIAFLREKLYMVFANKKKVILLTNAGLLNSVSFFKELWRRIGHQLIPDQPSQDSIQYVLNQLFYKPSDVKWLLRIPMENWKELLDILGTKAFYQNEGKTTSQ